MEEHIGEKQWSHVGQVVLMNRLKKKGCTVAKHVVNKLFIANINDFIMEPIFTVE